MLVEARGGARLVAVAFVVAGFVGCEGSDVSPDAGFDAAAGDGGDAGVADADAGPVTPEPVFLRDAEGGVVMLRGTNVEGDAKWAADFLPTTYTTTADFERLSDVLGMNAVRFLIFWEAVEPEPEMFDDAYLAEVRRRVDAAHEAGLLVVVDMHQDVYGRGFGGDGAPRWACDESLYASFTPPDNWFEGYFEPEVQECFDRLWLDPETRGHYGRMWAHVAEALSGSAGVFAYELMNEPSWGTTDLSAFERTVAPAAYAEWIDAIREADLGPYVVVAPASAANVGLPSALVPPDRERLVYGPHVYPPALELGTGWTGSLDDALGLAQQIERDGARMGLPVFVGETGARGEVLGALTFLDQMWTAFDEQRLSATQWDGGSGPSTGYALFDDSGAPSGVALSIARPHPARTAGVPRDWSWDRETATFVFEWEEDGSATGETRVTLPSVVFSAGVDATLDDGGEARVEGASLQIPQIGGDRRLVLTAL